MAEAQLISALMQIDEKNYKIICIWFPRYCKIKGAAYACAKPQPQMQ